MRRLIMTLAAAVTFAVASGFTALGQKANEVNFGIIATESSANLKQIWEPFLAAMAKATGLKPPRTMPA